MFTHGSIDKINEFKIFNGFKIFRSLKFNVWNAINIDFFFFTFFINEMAKNHEIYMAAKKWNIRISFKENYGIRKCNVFLISVRLKYQEKNFWKHYNTKSLVFLSSFAEKNSKIKNNIKLIHLTQYRKKVVSILYKVTDIKLKR